MTQNSRGRRRATRDDVARLAGVSSAVVSYVVNDGPRPVAAATKLRVLNAIDKLEYRPNVMAQSLIKGKSDLIGLVLPDFRNPYFATFAHAVEVAAAERGFGVLSAQAADDDLARVVRALSGRMLAGIVTMTLPNDAAMREIIRAEVPTLLLSLTVAVGPISALWSDYYDGAMRAVSHLVDVHGHSRIGLILGKEEVNQRERGWHDRLSQLGLGTEALVRVPFSVAGGRDGALAMRAQYPDVTAVLAGSDQLARGAMAGLASLGLAVPRDMALISFDGVPDSEFMVPSLTTVSVQFYDIAKDAVHRVLDHELNGHVGYPVELVVRESCGCGGAK